MILNMDTPNPPNPSPWTNMNTNHLLTEILIKVTEAVWALIIFQDNEVRDFVLISESKVISFVLYGARKSEQVKPEKETWLERKSKKGVKSTKWVWGWRQRQSPSGLWSVSASKLEELHFLNEPFSPFFSAQPASYTAANTPSAAGKTGGLQDSE